MIKNYKPVKKKIDRISRRARRDRIRQHEKMDLKEFQSIRKACAWEELKT